MSGTTKTSVAIAAVVALLVCFIPAFAQTSQPIDTVVEIRVEGNQQTSRNAVLSSVKTRVGQSYNPELIKADEQRLRETRRFESVIITKTQTPRGVIVTVVVTERPKIKSVSFVGNKAFKRAELVKELPFGAGEALDKFRVEAGRQAVQNFYRGKGYYQAEVTTDEKALADRREVIYRIAEGPQALVRKIRFEGNAFFRSLRLKFVVGSSTRFWPFVQGYLDVDQVDRDVITLRNMYVAEGFLDAEVGREYSFSADKKLVTIIFRIDEGPRYQVNRFIFRGNTIFSDRDLAERMKAGEGLESRGFFTAMKMRRSIEAVQNAYGEIGYINATVEARKQYLSPTSHPEWAPPSAALLNVIIQITEEDQYAVGKVIIRGNSVTQGRVIRRQLSFYPEQLFNTVAVEESRNRLLETRLFDKVTIAPVGREPHVRDALVAVQEGKTAEFLVGAGISSNNGLLGNISFTQRNFDLFKWPATWKALTSEGAFKGGGQTFSIVAEPGTEIMRFHIDWFEPYLFDQPNTLGNKIFVFNRAREAYDETRYGDVVSLGRRFPNRWYAELATRVEGVDISNLADDAPVETRQDEGTHLLIGFKGTLVRDRTDSRWLPSTGDRLRISYEEVVGGYTFSTAEGDYHIYRTLYTDALDRKHILAGRASIGEMFGDAPTFERYYGGGIGSIRGFQYRGVSPRGHKTNGRIGDKPIGGKFMVFLGSEYSFPLVADQLRGVLFVDSGTVENDFGVTTYRASVGAGVRWMIPLFGQVPLSLDFGFPVSQSSQDDTQIFSFNFGAAF